MTAFRLGLFLALCAVLLVAGVSGTRVLERSLRGRLEIVLSQSFGCQARSRGLFVHWTSRTLVVRGLSLSCPLTRGTGAVPGSSVPLVAIRQITARFDPLSLMNRVMALESLTIDGGSVTAVGGDSGDNYRLFLSRWVSGAHPAFSGAATIRKISIRNSDLIYRLSDPEMGVILHVDNGTLRSNLFMNRFRLEIPEGHLSGEVHGRVLSSPPVRISASFARGGMPDLGLMTRSGTGFLKLEGQVLSFETEPVVSLFVHGALPVAEVAPFLAAGGTPPLVLSGVVSFKSYLHGPLNSLKARAVLSSPDLRLGDVHLADSRMILSFSPGRLEARPLRTTVGTTKITGSVVARLYGNHPSAEVRLVEKGGGGLLGSFGLRANGTIPLPRGEASWGDFLDSLERLARVS